MVLHLPQGYDTPIGEGGWRCRAGSGSASRWRARCTAIPRCWCSTSRTPTSTRRATRRSLEALRSLKAEGRTVFVMTHRLNIVGEADAVMVLANGAIQAYGPREQVMNSLPGRPRPVAVDRKTANAGAA